MTQGGRKSFFSLSLSVHVESPNHKHHIFYLTGLIDDIFFIFYFLTRYWFRINFRFHLSTMKIEDMISV